MLIVRSKDPIHFLSKKEKEKVVEAIREAEKHTSGEIRIHLVKTAEQNIFAQAKEIFKKIGMAQTKFRNGVLILLAVQDRRFVILGDQGINEKVPEGFWDDMSGKMEGCFQQDRFGEGLTEAILQTGDKLKHYFSFQRNDMNELPDEISYSR